MTNGPTSGNMSQAHGIGDANQATDGLNALGERWSFCPRDGGALQADWCYCPKCGVAVGFLSSFNLQYPSISFGSGQCSAGQTTDLQSS